MQLDSYLELFTTLYGWAFANLLGEILTGTGLAALPFALIAFNAWHSAKEEGAGFNGVLALIESIQTKLITALLVMALCFATTPFTSLHNINLSYKPERAADGSEPQIVSTQGGTNSGYDRAMADAVNGSFARSGNLSYVPLWWYSVMGLSSGINGAFRAGMTSSERDLRVVADLARMATIEDPALLHDVQRFYSECFVPARSQYFSMDKNQISANGRGILAEGSIYGPTDVDWVGSQFFRTEPGFYDVMRSYNPVPGWSIDFNRDSEYMQGGASDQGFMNPDWGRPTCKQWWEADAATGGVRERLTSNTSTWRSLLQVAQNTITFSSTDEAKDAMAKLAFEKANPTFVSPDKMLGDDYGKGTNAWRTVTGGISTIGVGKQAFESSLGMVPLLNMLPMLQALVLMALYMFLPLIVVISCYDLKVMVIGGLAIFTVKFWAVMWYVARWLDAHLIEAMYPGLTGSALMQEITQSVSSGQPQLYKRMILNTLLAMMFIALPLIWSSMMAWVGYRLGFETSSINKAGSLSDSAGKGSSVRLKR